MQEKSTQPRCRISTLFAEASLAKLFQSLGDGEASQIPEGPCSLKSLEYIGDALLQKTLTTDTLPRVHRVNKGEQTKYYVENNHPPIISREEFEAVQAIMK